MNYWVEFITQEQWKQYQINLEDDFQNECHMKDVREDEYCEMADAYYCDTGELLTIEHFNRLSPNKWKHETPEYPTGHSVFCNSKQSAQEYAFLKNLEGCKTRIFYSPGKDDDGDDLWEQI